MFLVLERNGFVIDIHKVASKLTIGLRLVSYLKSVSVQGFGLDNAFLLGS